MILTSTVPAARLIAVVLCAGTVTVTALSGCGSAEPVGAGAEPASPTSTEHRRHLAPTAGTSIVRSNVVDDDAGDPPATGLHPGLEQAFDRARSAAAAEGLTLVVNSGYRTAARQEELLAEAVAEHGSLEAATRWVFPPERSMHVQGLAVDVGDGGAADWLDANGSRWGLCRTLDWERWHFEWRERWERSATCPDPVDDPADAPGV